MKITKKKIIAAIILFTVVGGIVTSCVVKPGKRSNMEEYLPKDDIVVFGDVEETITGSASIEPYERYEIIALVSGDIVSSPYEEGDKVKKGDLLYKFDTSSVSLGIQKQELSLEQSKNNYNMAVEEAEKLIIKAPCAGVISGLDLRKGKEVSPGNILAKIENTYDLKVELPFNDYQVQKIYVGDTATVSSSFYMSGVLGNVTHIAENPTQQEDGSMLYNVTINISNPGAFTAGLVVGGEIKGMVSPGSGVIKNGDSEQVTPEVSGKVENIYVSNGDFVNKGDTLIKLSSDTISNSIKNSDIQYKSSGLSLRESRDSLDDYTLTSPINGTVITKNKKAGDTIDRTTATQALMVVADVSKLKFTLSIDELDISKVVVGQNVIITCDALEGEEYRGKITNVSVEGNSTNGVTVYEAEVVIDEPGNLRPSMNIDAKVVFAASENTLMIPTGDLKTVMGKSYVFVKNSNDEEKDTKKDKKNKKLPQDKPWEEKGPKMPEAPEGYETKEIEIGLSNDEYTEVLSGLKEGDQVYRIAANSSSGVNNMMMMGGMNGMGGNMRGNMGGGAPGGMGGGMR